MLKNNKGFTLLECLVSLLVLSIGIQFLLPALVKCRAEMQVVTEQETALELLHNALVLWEQTETLPPTSSDVEGIHYIYDWQSRAPTIGTLCIKWSYPSSRHHSECGEMKR